MAGISQTRPISHLQHRRESFTVCIIALLCGTYQSAVCTQTLAEGVYLGGSLTIRTTPTHLRNNNTATHFTDLGRMEG